MNPRFCLTAALAIVSTFAQPTAGPRPGGPRSGGPRPSPIDPIIMNDVAGFESIFDGTLKNWDGSPDYWRVENNIIVGETTKENPLKVNNFLIWRGGQPADFELKLEYKMNATNSGVQYRSVELPEVGKWVMKGYQADIDFQNTYTGQLYEERGRGFLAMRGQFTRLQAGGKPRLEGIIKNSDDAKGIIKIGDWNQLHIIARGNVLIHVLNGQVTSLFIDDDPKGRAMSGLLGFQIHMGPPMKVEFRNIFLKKL